MKERFLPITGGKTVCASGGADEQSKTRINEILNAEDKLNISGRVFYVSQSGCNQNDGQSPLNAYQTLEAIKSLCYELKSGDTVLLERGGIYRLPLDMDLTNGVTYGAYGVGEKPVVCGSYMNYAKEEIWINKGNNIWSIPYFPHTDAGVIVFNDGEESGTKCFNLEELEANDYYFHDLDEHSLYLYCDKGNPGLVYEDIEIGVMTRLFHLECNAHDITIDNIKFEFTGLFAVRSDGGCQNIKITNCIFAWLGGSLFPDRSNRFGNAIEFSSGCENVLIENCWFYQLYDCGATFQIGSGPFRNFTVRNNVFEYTGMGGFEWWAQAEVRDSGKEVPFDDTVIENILIENNIMRLNGYGWSKNTRHPCHIRGTWAPRDYPNLKNFIVRDNIFDCSYGFIIACAWSEPPKEYIMKNNTYYQKPTKKIDVNDSGYPAFDLSYNNRTYANNQSELEAAVLLVEKEPKLIKWLD